MDKIKIWFIDNQFEINWFLIGFLCSSGLEDFGHGDLFGALFAFGIAFVNYALNRR